MGRRILLTILIGSLLAPTIQAESETVGPGAWWTVDYTELVSNERTKVTFLVFGAEEGRLQVGLAMDSLHAAPFVLPLFPIGDVDASDLSYKSYNATFHPIARPFSEGTTWSTEWDGTPLTGRIVAITDDLAHVQFTRDDGAPFSELDFDLKRHLVVRHAVPGYGNAVLDAAGPSSECHGAYPTKIDDLPLHIGRHLIMEGEHDFLALRMTATAPGPTDVAHISVASTSGETWEARAGPADQPQASRLAFATASPGLWQTLEFATPDAAVSLKAIGVKHEMLYTGEIGQHGTEACMLHSAMPADDRPLTFAGTTAAPGDARILLAATFGLGGLATLAWYVTRYARYTWLAPLFVKLTKDQVENQHVRSAMMELLRVRPGLTTQQVRNELELAWGEAVHHLDVLHRSGLVQPMNWGRNRHWFDPRRHNPAERALLVALAHEGASRILNAVKEHPGARQKELAQKVSLHRATVSFHMHKLEGLGLLERRSEDGEVRYFFAPGARRPD